MISLLESCEFGLLTEALLQEARHFSCGNDDLDDFFAKDSIVYANQMMGKTYAFYKKTEEGKVEIVCAFTVSNSSIFTTHLSWRLRAKVGKLIDESKHSINFPAVLIGRLGINVNYHHQHLGSEVLDFIKNWFTQPEYWSSCRFLVVDAYSEEGTLAFYEKNDFNFLFKTEDKEKEYRNVKSEKPLHTRMMYFDLMQVMS